MNVNRKLEIERSKPPRREIIEKEVVKVKEKCEECSKRNYEVRNMLFDGVTGLSILYALFVTVFCAIRSEVFRSDFKGFFMGAWEIIRQAWGKLYELALWCSQLGDKIDQETIALIVHWLIIIVVIGVILGIIAFGVMLLIGNEFTSECKENYMDNVSLTIIFISLGIVVFLGEYIKSVVAINLIGLFFIAIVVYLIARFILDKRR